MKIDRCIAEEKAAAEERKIHEAGGEEDEEKKEVEKPRPNPALEQGKKLPPKMGKFPAVLYGKPIEDLDEYYHNKPVRIIGQVVLLATCLYQSWCQFIQC